MKKIKVIKPTHQHQNDIERIVALFATKKYLCTTTQAQEIWENYSKTADSDWSELPESDSDLWDVLDAYWEEDIIYKMLQAQSEITDEEKKQIEKHVQAAMKKLPFSGNYK